MKQKNKKKIALQSNIKNFGRVKSFSNFAYFNENSKSNLIKFLILLISLSLTLTILFSTFNSKLYDEKLYMNLYEKNNIKFNESIRENKTNEVINFLKNKGSLDKSFFTENEISHMEDVRKIFNGLKKIYLLSLFITLFGITFLVYKKLSIRRAFIYSFILSILLIILFLLPFNFLFDNMHNLLFPQGNYSFDNSSNLIQLFPAGFFLGFLQSVIISFMLKEVLILGLSFLMNNNSNLKQRIHKNKEKNHKNKQKHKKTSI